MASRIEQQIDEITQYIDSCKYAAFSSDKILVDRDKLLDMLSDLRGNMRFPAFQTGCHEFLHQMRMRSGWTLQCLKYRTAQRREHA